MILPRNGSREKRDDVEQIWDLTSHHMGDTIKPSSETWQMFLKQGGGRGRGRKEEVDGSETSKSWLDGKYVYFH